MSVDGHLLAEKIRKELRYTRARGFDPDEVMITSEGREALIASFVADRATFAASGAVETFLGVPVVATNRDIMGHPVAQADYVGIRASAEVGRQ